MVLVLIFLAPYLFWLPKAVLSSVIVVNLRGLFLKYPEAYFNLYKKKRYTDFILFSVTNVAVLLLGLDTGLYIALVTELFIVFFKLRSSFSLKVDRYKTSETNTGVQTVTVSGSILFGNSSDVEKDLKETKIEAGSILDCNGLTYLDHAGYDILKVFVNRFERVVCADKKMAEKLLGFVDGDTNVDESDALKIKKVTEIYPSFADAIADSDIKNQLSIVES